MTRVWPAAVITAAVCAACTPVHAAHKAAPTTTVPASTTTIPAGYLVDDQFNGHTLNPHLWQTITTRSTPADRELQHYQPSQVSESGGMLRIVAQRQSDGTWLSGRVQSRWHYRYATYTFRAKVTHIGQGLWPAGWLYGITGTSPADGEIDALEESDGHPWDWLTIHGATPGGQPWQISHPHTPFNLALWHTYSIQLDPGTITILIDHHPAMVAHDRHLPHHGQWPYNTNTYAAVLNIAVGGNWPGPPNPSTPSRAELDIDWYTVTPLAGGGA